MQDRWVTVHGVDGRIVCARCVVADTARKRMRGLLGKRELDPYSGVLLRPAGSVHTLFMRFPIDVVFVDRQLVVRRVVHELRPWRAAGARGAHAALELAPGAAARARLEVGERLTIGGAGVFGRRRRAARALARAATVLCAAAVAFAGSAVVGPGETAHTQAPRDPEARLASSFATMAALTQLGGDEAQRVPAPRLLGPVETAIDVLRVTKHLPAGEPEAPLRRGDARQLVRVARLLDVHWADVLTGVRVHGGDDHRRFSRYYRAVGLEGMVEGLDRARGDLATRVLQDPRIDVYFGGRMDIGAGRVDARVLALVLYLAETYGQVSVSSLISGHPLYARPGVISAHVPGRAVDIARLGGITITANQYAGSITQRAVVELLRVPAAIRPAQIISLLDLGGPSFALRDHHDHIHVGYDR